MLLAGARASGIGGRTMAIANQIAAADFYSTDPIPGLTETVPA
jgi:hypothetical protein